MMDGKPDLRLCPFCGNREPRYMVLNVSKIKVMVGVKWQKCLTCGPGECGKDREEAEAKAAEAWNRRAAPENRVLTLEEVKAHCEGGVEAAPLWVEFSRLPSASRWMAARVPDMVCGESIKKYSNAFKYNVMFRCWIRKPTAEETANTPWEE